MAPPHRTNHPRIARTIMRLFGAILLLALIMPVPARAAEGHITLLTIVEGETETGGVADLYLTTRPGDGAIFVDSFPLTKLDTQSSIRYANQIACDFLDEDCSRHDFFYTIRANSAIVGGPSAGAAVAALTVAVLDGETIDQGTAMTGTINSGGIIGPVAGISAKAEGARAAGIDKVIIPALTSEGDLRADDKSGNETENETENGTERDAGAGHSDDGRGADDESTADNTTIVRPVRETIIVNASTAQRSMLETPLYSGRVDSLSGPGFDVIGVATLEEAMRELTGKDYARKLPPMVAPPEYTARMRSVATDICERTAALRERVDGMGAQYDDANNYSARIAALPASDDYTRASLCFSANIELGRIEVGGASAAERAEMRGELIVDAEALDEETKSRNITTIGDLETYAIVQERVLEARQVLDGLDHDEPDPDELGYARERLRSARSWSAFFGMPGRAVQIDEKHLRRACLSKLGEAEERASYVRLYSQGLVDDVDASIAEARSVAGDEPIICVFAASKAKAQANLLASALTVGDGRVDSLIAQKLAAADRSLRIQQSEGIFPIIGYSYAQYAENLRGAQPYSALTFAEYSLELSTIDIYFPKASPWRIPASVRRDAPVFILGAAFGAMIVTAIILHSRQRTPQPIAKTRGTDGRHGRRRR